LPSRLIENERIPAEIILCTDSGVRESETAGLAAAGIELVPIDSTISPILYRSMTFPPVRIRTGLLPNDLSDERNVKESSRLISSGDGLLCETARQCIQESSHAFVVSQKTSCGLCSYTELICVAEEFKLNKLPTSDISFN
jgi:hypothetical protein